MKRSLHLRGERKLLRLVIGLTVFQTMEGKDSLESIILIVYKGTNLRNKSEFQREQDSSVASANHFERDRQQQR